MNESVALLDVLLYLLDVWRNGCLFCGWRKDVINKSERQRCSMGGSLGFATKSTTRVKTELLIWNKINYSNDPSSSLVCCCGCCQRNATELKCASASVCVMDRYLTSHTAAPAKGSSLASTDRFRVVSHWKPKDRWTQLLSENKGPDLRDYLFCKQLGTFACSCC